MDGLERIFTTEEGMANFDLEKLANEYCAEYGIDRYDPIWGQVVSAFCVGAKIERERCAKVAEEFNTFPCALSSVGKIIADEIRMRSNAKVSGAGNEDRTD